MNDICNRTANELLGSGDPKPVEVVDVGSEAPVVLVCEHAGREIPGVLGDLGLARGILESHRGWDIGAEALARGMSAQLGAPLVIQRYSRLVIDCNRPPGSEESIPEVCDGQDIPANDVDGAEREARENEIFHPMDRAISDLFEAHPRHAAFSVHSFTPEIGRERRPWHAGFLSRCDIGCAEEMLEHVKARRPDLTLAVNEPYRIDTRTDWFIPAHAEKRGVRHCLIEVRNDQVRGDEGISKWTDLLAGAAEAFMEGQYPWA